MPGFQAPKRVDVAIGIVIHQGLFLISRRRVTDSFGGFWEFPGGKCEPDETPEQTVRRELMEELAISVTPVRAFAVIEHRYPKSEVRLHPFVCRLDAGAPEAIHVEEFRWVPARALPDFKFPAANAGLLLELMRGDFDLGASE